MENYQTPFGTVSLSQNEKGIHSLMFVKNARSKKALPAFDLYKKYKLNPQGTLFQKQVWKVLLKIKKGQTKTYAEVAQMVGRPTAVRAVASAVAKNSIAVLIPCHRVVRSDGGVGEYRWGKKWKERVLNSEKMYLNTFKLHI